jgi:hypothetical protein
LDEKRSSVLGPFGSLLDEKRPSVLRLGWSERARARTRAHTHTLSLSLAPGS